MKIWPLSRGRLLLFVRILLSTGIAFLPHALAPSPARAQEDQTITYPAGWNLVAGPSGTDFSAASGSLYTLQPGDSDYESIDVSEDPQTGYGYWAYFTSGATVDLAESTTDSYEVEALAESWLMAGNPGATAARVTGADAVYLYDPASGFTLSSTLPPGRGALVYSAGGGVITVTPASAANTIRSASSPLLAAAAPTPGATATALGPAPVQVVASGFGQSKPGGPVGVAVLLRNTGSTAQDATPLSLTVYDAHGSVIAAGDTTVHLIQPGETTGFVHRLSVTGSGAVAARVDVQAGQGRAAGNPPPGSLSFGQQSLVPGRSSLDASATLTSSYATDLVSVHIDVLVYDAGGGIIGGGAITKRLVAAGATEGIVVPVQASGTPARLEFYAQLP